MQFPLFALILGLTLVLPAAEPGEKIFNGRDLRGWSGDPRLWSVEDGAIVGRTDKAGRSIRSNTFLIYENAKPGDFQLTYKARVTGNNSGVQYRSRVVDGDTWRLAGYQMDLHPNQSYLGMLYEEGGRGIACERGQKIVLRPEGEPEITGSLEVVPTDLSEWNEYKIVARDHRLQHYVNGELAAVITDMDQEKRAMEGVIGLQLHAGPAMEVAFKDIVLSDPPARRNQATTDPDVVRWIWSGKQAKPMEKVFFRKEFDLPEGVTDASITVTCDNWQQTWINGHDLGLSSDWNTPARYSITEHLRLGQKNVIAVEGRNDDGAAAMALRFTATLPGGNTLSLVSDGSWQMSSESGEGWQRPDFDASGWEAATVVAKMGESPWGEVITDRTGEALPVDVTQEFKVLPGFKLEKLYAVPEDQGSWVAMTVDPAGNLICSDQYGSLYRVEVGSGEVEKLPIPLGGAHGLLWFADSLFVTVNESVGGPSGVYRVPVAEDGGFGPPELVKAVAGRGEHGPHALVPSPDGEWIYFCAGNMTKLASMDGSLAPEVWQEDQLLPRRPDARGHAANVMAPGGWIARFRPDGSNWELVATGFRNQYDIAFNDRGDLFSYDADMEWDLGLPWYRPTRICHVIPGAEFGWRNGTGKWPAYFEDSMPAVVDLGPGSPTGLVSGKGAKFPAKYQKALYALDWTYATIYVIHLDEEGASYGATTEELVAGRGLPLTDAEIGADGAMYFLTGGRRTDSALWRVSYVGDESTEAVEYATEMPAGLAAAEAREGLSSPDRVMRQQARLYFEMHPDRIPSDLGEDVSKPWEAIVATIIQARLHEGAAAKKTLPALTALDFPALDQSQKLAWLRAASLAFIRGDGPTEEERQSVLDVIDPAYPATDEDLNAELVRVLAYLRAPGVVGRTLALMDSAPPPVAPDWLEIATRNDRYGNDVNKMIAALPPARIIHYIYALRTVPGPWERSDRERFFEWLKRLTTKSGGNSYAGFIEDLRKQTLETATPEEREWLEEFAPPENADPLASLPPVKGPGRVWTVDELVELGEKGFEGADRAHGEEMYKATLCAACHSYGGQGGAAGPELSNLAGRFTVKSLAEALIEPSKEVSDQYAFDVVSKKNGDQIVGRLIEEKDESWIIAVNPFDFGQTVEVERNEVKEVKPSPVSPMPGGLINRLNENELRDLLAFLLSK